MRTILLATGNQDKATELKAMLGADFEVQTMKDFGIDIDIIEDGLNDFFFQHVIKYKESWNYPIHFVGGVAFGFRDVVSDLCSSYELELGKILQHPIEGLIQYHK